MRARIGLWAVVLLISLQPLPLVGAHSVDEAAAHARLHQARHELADGATDAAEGTLQSIFADFPDADVTPRAFFQLAHVRRTAGDCAGAVRALDAALSDTRAVTEFGPYPHLLRAMCLGRLDDYRGQLAAAQRALAIETGGPRLTRIEVLEEAAEASLKLGRKQDALNFYNQSLELAGSRAYRAEMLFTTATIARALGDDALAVDRFRAVVVEFPETARGVGALDALVEMDRHGVISPLQGGTARLQGREYTAALTLFDQVGPESPDWGAARFGYATTLIRQGREDEARRTLLGLADADGGQAGRALLQLGQLQERAGEFAEAEATYVRATGVPDGAAEAWYRAGFVRYVRGDHGGALAAFNAGLTVEPKTPVVAAQLWYWAGRLAAPGSAEAQRAFSEAAAAAPESFHGLRAAEAMNRTLTAASSRFESLLRPSAEETAELAAWLGSLGTTQERLAGELDVVPGLRRADALLELGLRTEAAWEVDAVMRRYVEARDVARLSALGEWLMQRDLPHLVLQVGRQERELAGLYALPTAVQKHVYPPGWGDLVLEHAARHSLDPLLILALMRQESSFDPRAQSNAQAMGLMQVIPSTARSIAARLGHDDFALRDLFKPAVSLEYGSWFLGQVLREFDGRPFPALAAYNAGGGNVSRWLSRFGDDPDVLVELVPFTETRTYLRIVYENYAQYRRLYAN